MIDICIYCEYRQASVRNIGLYVPYTVYIAARVAIYHIRYVYRCYIIYLSIYIYLKVIVETHGLARPLPGRGRGGGSRGGVRPGERLLLRGRAFGAAALAG